MSVEALAVCLHHSRAKGTAKLVLLGIANHEGDGGSWPTIATLARYANTTERSVQYAIEKLESLHELQVVDQAGGTVYTSDSRRPNLYRVLVCCPGYCDHTTQHRDTRKHAGRQGVLLPVDKGMRGEASFTPGVKPASPKPSLEPSNNSVVATSVTTGRACNVCSQPEERCLAASRTNGHTFEPRPS